MRIRRVSVSAGGVAVGPDVSIAFRICLLAVSLSPPPSTSSVPSCSRLLLLLLLSLTSPAHPATSLLHLPTSSSLTPLSPALFKSSLLLHPSPSGIRPSSLITRSVLSNKSRSRLSIQSQSCSSLAPRPEGQSGEVVITGIRASVW